jgi:hypothetical protein
MAILPGDHCFMSRFSTLTLPLFLLVPNTPQAFGETVSLGVKLGHQHARFEGGSLGIAEITRVTDGWGENEQLFLSQRAPMQLGDKNGPVAGLRLSLTSSYWGLTGEFDYAQFSAQPGSTLLVYGLGGSGEVNLVKQPWIRIFGLAGFRASNIQANRNLKADFLDQEEVLETEPIWTLNRDWGVGVELPLQKDLTLGFLYRRSESLAADGEYRQVIRRTDSFNNRIITQESRAAYEDFRYSFEEFTVSINLRSPG